MGYQSFARYQIKAIIVALMTVILVLMSSVGEARLYKWFDADGQIRYGDQLPPEYINKKHFQLDAEGRIIMTKEAGKSPKQLKKERELAEKKKEEDDLAEKKRIQQNQIDRILLLTFNSEDDIFYARDQRLQVLDSKITLFNKNKTSSQKKLINLNEQANKFYLSKQLDIPGGLQQKIEQMSKNIISTKNNIIQSERKREEVVINFKRELERFRDLKSRQRKTK